MTQAATTLDGSVAPTVDRQRVPLFALIVLALAGFILVSMETMPAGLLPAIAAGMNTDEGTVGLFVSAYALGTVVVTVPAISLTAKFRRKPLLLIGMTGLLIANAVTALSTDVVLSLSSRFVAGSFSGILWGMLAMYAIRISPATRSGLALSIMSVGAPLGFAFGTPLGAFIGVLTDWRWSFIGLSAAALLIVGIAIIVVPNASGQAASARRPLGSVLRLRGVALVLAVILVWMLGHSTIYTYIAPYLRVAAVGITPDLFLLVYGVASLVGVGVTGALLDRHPRALLHVSAVAFVVAGLVLLVAHSFAPAVMVAACLWGISFGGAPAQLQNALTRAGRESSDVANSFLPVAFNLAIFGAGVLGASVLAGFDGLALPFVMVALGAVVVALTIFGRRSGFRWDSTSSDRHQ